MCLHWPLAPFFLTQRSSHRVVADAKAADGGGLLETDDAADLAVRCLQQDCLKSGVGEEPQSETASGFSGFIFGKVNVSGHRGHRCCAERLDAERTLETVRFPDGVETRRLGNLVNSRSVLLGKASGIELLPIPQISQNR